MNISSNNALQIVNEISEIINQHVNMMDAGGIIIASTDPERVGNYHAGAAKIIAEHLDELIIHHDDAKSGVKKGINLPIIFHGEFVGVVGITGERDAVVKYGRVIKKMTEILLLECALAGQEHIDERIKARFLDTWLFEDTPTTPQFIERGKCLGIDVTLPRRVMVVEILEFNNYSDSPAGQVVIDTADKAVRQIVERNPQNLFIKSSSHMICLVQECNEKNLRYLANEIQKNLSEQFHINVTIGIGEFSNNIYKSYIEAKKALLSFAYSSTCSIKFYNELDIELFIDEISLNSKIAYIKKIFKSFSDQEIHLYIHILQTYFSNNCSITKTAQLLFMHKNTLQYKLKKIHEKTGYDPRNCIDASFFFWALQFHYDVIAKNRT